MIDNGLMMQYFEYHLDNDGSLWNNLAAEAKRLAAAGVTSVQLPPAFKGVDGASDSGFSVYDVYDLGEFRQKGSVRTKYGTKDEYLKAVKALQKSKINVYADAVLNRKVGADYVEQVTAAEFNQSNRYQMIGEDKVIGAWTGFNFPGRKGKYSDFVWNWKHFSGIDWEQNSLKEVLGITDDSKAADYDYLMGADIDFSNGEVFDEFVRWAVWYIKTTNIDGFALDAAACIPSNFVREFLMKVRELTGRELFTVGEYWNGDVRELTSYLGEINSEASLFDVPLHYNFFHCSEAHGAYDLRRIFDNSLVKKNPLKAVTFVDNHNSQPGQILESFVEEWFKPLAYALILLRRDGYPCVFYGDYYGINNDKYKGGKAVLDKLMKLRKAKAYGEQHDYFDDPDCIGWTREGDEEHKDSGLAVIMSDGRGGTKRMYIGRKFAGQHFSDILGNAKYNIKIDDEGFGEFYVNRCGVSVWVHKEPKTGVK